MELIVSEWINIGEQQKAISDDHTVQLCALSGILQGWYHNAEEKQ